MDLVNRQEVEHTIFICEHKKTKEIRIFDRDPRLQGPKTNKLYTVLECTEVTFERDIP